MSILTMARQRVTLQSLYSSMQCILSVVGSVGVILLFAGIPQLIYSPDVKPANLMTFLLGAVLMTTMVAGNALINYKYRQQNMDQNQNNNEGVPGTVPEDKPPSYDDLVKGEVAPPSYSSYFNGKPPRYEDITSDGHNWSSVPSNNPSSCTTDIVPCQAYMDVVNSSTSTVLTNDKNNSDKLEPHSVELLENNSKNGAVGNDTKDTEHRKNSLFHKNFVVIDISEDKDDNVSNTVKSSDSTQL